MGTTRPSLMSILLASALGCASQSAAIAPVQPDLPLGTPQGDTTSLAALHRGHDATVLVFWRGGCPCVRRYQERVDALLDTYPANRVRVVGISSNAGEPFREVLQTAQDRGVRIPIYRDEGGLLADALDVHSTPAVVLLDRHGDVRFHGWLDNEHVPGESGREPWLDRAIVGVLDGTQEFAARTPTYGCTITRQLGGGPEPVSTCMACAASHNN